MTEVHTSHAAVTVWLSNDENTPLHEGGSVEYIIEIEDGKPVSYQRTQYYNGEVVGTNKSENVGAVPTYIRNEVERHMIPKRPWE